MIFPYDYTDNDNNYNYNNYQNQRWLATLLLGDHAQDAEELDLKPAPDISIPGMVIAGTPILFVAIVSLYLKLHNVTTLLIAATRCVVQLIILGLLLYPIFRNNQVSEKEKMFMFLIFC